MDIPTLLRLAQIRPFQPMADLPRGGGVKKALHPVKQQVGFEPGTLSTVKCFKVTGYRVLIKYT